MTTSTNASRIARIQLLTLDDPIAPSLLERLGATDERGLVSLVEVRAAESRGTGIAVGSFGTGRNARELSWRHVSELSELLLDEPVHGDGDASTHQHAHELVAANSHHLVSDVLERRISISGVLAGLAEAITRAVAQLTAPTAPLDPAAVLAELVPHANRYHVVPAPPPMRIDGRPANRYPELDFLRPLGVNGTKGHLLERQALAQGFRTMRFSKGAFVADRDGGPQLNFKWSRSPIASGVSLALCTHKEATRIQLRRRGLPAPRGRMFARGDYDTAKTYAKHIGYPVVCKPASGVRGIGVVADIRDEHELDDAFQTYQESRLGGDDFIIEEHIAGGDYRIVVIDDQVVAAILRQPASVIGDGQQTVAELVLQKNELRRQNPHLWGRLIKVGRPAIHRLARQGFDLTSVPPAGVQVRLSDTCSLSQGGDSIDVLDELHPSIAEASVAAVRAIPGMRYCGVDFLMEDHRRPLAEQHAAGICELNAHAAIGNGEYPMFGTPREVARELFARSATTAGYDVPEPAQELTLRLEIHGKVTRVNYRQWLARHAEDFGVSGWVRNLGRRKVEAVLHGPTLPVSALASLTVLGPRRALPTTVRTEHVQVTPRSGFEVRR